MSLADDLIAFFAPHCCLGCGAEGSLLCERCSAALPTVPERCYRCRKLSADWRTCSSCHGQSRLRSVTVTTVYDGLAKKLAWRLKFHGAQAAATQMAQRIVNRLQCSPDSYVVPVPTATSRVRQRGYDQAKLIARAVARQTGLPYLDCLRRSGQMQQVGASRRLRRLQLSQAFRARRVSAVRGASVILIDDIVTTGATLEAAAGTLRAAGARHVDAAVYAQP
jgi:ComF family protein